MDVTMAWLQPEQQGPACTLFSRLWSVHERAQPPPGGRQQRVPDLIDHHVPAADCLAAEVAAAPPPILPSRRPPPGRDRSCTTELDSRRAELVGQHGGTPWMVPDKVYRTGVLGLHEEIEDFFSYMSPTPEEHYMREYVYSNIEKVIMDLWEGAKVFIFGSFETGLYLPTSDIDIVVMGSWDKSLELLKDALIRADICDPASIKVLDKAAVPIIKLTDRRTDVKVDISFNMKNGLLSASTIKQYQVEYPDMPKLVIALKQFLLQRELNEVFTGGISSYSLILMTVGFLQDQERKLPPYVDRDLGTLLIEFFELYGLKFNYLKTCIKVKDRGYAPRSEVEEQFAAHSAHNSPLCIEDPHNVTNDIGRSSYNMMKVKDAFKYAYQRLSAAVLSPGVASDPNKQSILGRVILVTDRVVEYRRSIRERFSLRAPSSSPNSSSSPLSSVTSDMSDQDVEGCDSVSAGRCSAPRDTSPAGSGSGRSAPHSGHGHGAGRGGHGHGHGPGRGGGGGGGGRRPVSGGSHYPAMANGSHHPPGRNRRHQNGHQRRKAGVNGSSSQSDGAALATGGGQGGRPTRHHQPNRAGQRDS